MRPSLRFYIIFCALGGGSACLAMVWDMTSTLITLGIADGFLLALAWWDSVQGRSHRIQAQRAPLGVLSIGQDNPITLTFHNPSPQNVLIRLQDDYPTEFPPPPDHPPMSLAPQSTVTVTYEVTPTQRGQFHWGKLNLQQLGPLGLSWHQWQVETPQTVTVYPDLLHLKALTIRLTQPTPGALKHPQTLGMGTEFRELRDYQAGDDLRYVDWKASARRGVPLVRVLEPEREQTVMILLDRGRLMTAWVKGLRRFDWGLNAALALAVTVLQRGDRLGIGVFDREIVTWLPPERGMGYFPKILKQLTPLQPVLWEPDYVGAINRLVQQQTRRALVVCLTDLIDLTASAELLEALLRLTPRYLPFCVTLRDPQLDAIAHQSTTEITPAYQKAVALNLLQQRQVAIARLKQKGVLVLDAPAHQVREPLVERYLQLKARTLL